MLVEERMILYGRGTTGNGYVGALGTAASVTLAAVSASLAPAGVSTLTSGSPWVIVAADAGDLLGTNGTTMHEGPATAAASVAVTSGQAIQVTVGVDVPGALGYNLYVGSVSAGPFYYAGRTGFNVGYVTSQPSTGPTTTSSATDQSAVSTNFDGILSNLAASASYVKRLNSTFSTTNPGTEFQNAYATLYEAVKADPDEIWLNGFDRLQLSNALLNNPTNNAYRVVIGQEDVSGVKVGTVVAEILNQVTGKSNAVLVHPFMPQGNAWIRSTTLPLPDANISETFAMALVQDYAQIAWPPVQFTYDSSTILIGTLFSYAPTYSALIQGIQGSGVPQSPPDFSDN